MTNFLPLVVVGIEELKNDQNDFFHCWEVGGQALSTRLCASDCNSVYAIQKKMLVVHLVIYPEGNTKSLYLSSK